MQDAGNAVETPLPVYIHIIKAAGHSVRALLHENYPSGDYCDYIVRGVVSDSGLVRTPSSGDVDISTLVAEVRAKQHSLSWVALNLSYGLHEFLNRPVSYITFVREPVDRCVSYWYFAYRERDHHPAWRMFERYRFDIERIMCEPDGAILVNHQTRMITGGIQLPVTHDDVLLAQRRIQDDFLFVGTVERFAECVDAIGHLLGWPKVEYPALNVGNRTDAGLLPENALEQFSEANTLDRQLYDWVQAEYLPGRIKDALSAAAGTGPL
jgi:hypothetical protein